MTPEEVDFRIASSLRRILENLEKDRTGGFELNVVIALDDEIRWLES